MKNVKTTARGIKAVESASNYGYQQSVNVRGVPARKVGAYGMMEHRIPQIASAMGIDGADWRDPAVQDRIAEAALTRSYEELQDWNLAAVAFRFGMPLARYFKGRGVIEPGDMEVAGYGEAGKYVRNVRRNTPKTEQPISGEIKVPGVAIPEQRDGAGVERSSSPQRRGAEGVIRNQLIGLRNAQRVRSSNQPAEEPTEETP